MVYIFLANGFEETEAIAPIDILRRAGADVVTVGISGSTATSSHNIAVKCDITAEDAKLGGDLEMIILPGGKRGTDNLDASPLVQSAIEYCANNDIRMAAICAAPSVLGKRGVLKGKKAICYPGFEKFLEGAEISDKKVVTDGKITTAAGAGVSVQFGLELVRVLYGAKRSEDVKEQIQCES